MRRIIVATSGLLCSVLFTATSLSACGSTARDSGFSSSGASGASGGTSGTSGFGSSGTSGDGGPSPGCVGLQCQQHTCSGGGSTTVSGVVYDPAAKNPLYNVVVYVPNDPVTALPTGPTCDACNSLYTGSPIATALTDASGKFTLTNVPDGTNIPVVVQIGKWRRQFVLPTVMQCQDNPQPDKLLRLPKNQTEGDIPNIAISTGGADSLECLLTRVGIDDSEYGGGAGGSGRIHIFQGGGPGGAPNTSPGGPESSKSLWDSTADLSKFDIVLLSCEGDETSNMNQGALVDYAGAGGRVFASHFHYSWFNSGPFGSANLASWSPGTNDLGDITGSIVTTFPKGMALQQWLGNVGALSGGNLPISQARHNADVGASNTASQPWINAASGSSVGATEYFTFNTPTTAPAASQCGRVVYSDLHVGAASGDYSGFNSTVPSGCGNGDLSPQEKALEFMLFDLSSCVVPDSQPPTAPPVVVK